MANYSGGQYTRTQKRPEHMTVIDKKVVDAWELYSQSFADFIEDMIGIPVDDPGGECDLYLDPQQKEFVIEVSNLINAKLFAYEHCYNIRTKEYYERKMPNWVKYYYKKKGISIRSGKGNGKDMIVSLFILYALTVFPDVLIPITGPKYDQVVDIVTREVSTWKDRMDSDGNYIFKLRSKITIHADKIFRNDTKDPSKSNYAIIRTSAKNASVEQQKQCMAGLHAFYMFPIYEEADGVPPAAAEPLDETMTGPVNFCILIFNPNTTKGFAYESHYHKKEREKYILLHWNSEDSHCVMQGKIEEMRDKYWPTYPEGRPRNHYRVNVWGEPPTEEEDSLISYEKIFEANDRSTDVPDDYPIVLGIDAAGQGKDRFSVAAMQSYRVIAVHEIDGIEPDVIFAGLCSLILQYGPAAIAIEFDGPGWEIYYKIKKRFPYVKLVKLQMGGNARDIKKFKNKRAECWWHFRTEFNRDVFDLPEIYDLTEEMQAIKWDKDGSGKIYIISKLLLKKALGRSPDYADAVMIASQVNHEVLPRGVKCIGRGWENRRSGMRKRKSCWAA